MIRLNINPAPGGGIEETFIEAHGLAVKLKCDITFMFNGIFCLVKVESKVLSWLKDYNERLDKYHLKK